MQKNLKGDEGDYLSVYFSSVFQGHFGNDTATASAIESKRNNIPFQIYHDEIDYIDFIDDKDSKSFSTFSR